MIEQLQKQVPKQLNFDKYKLIESSQKLILDQPCDLSYLDQEITKQMLLQELKQSQDNKTHRGQYDKSNSTYGRKFTYSKSQYGSNTQNYNSKKEYPIYKKQTTYKTQQKESEQVEQQTQKQQNEKQIQQNIQQNESITINIQQDNNIQNNKQDQSQEIIQQQQKQEKQEEKQQIQKQEEKSKQQIKKQQNTIQINENTQWYYKDLKNNTQGPFSNERMLKWYQKGLLPANLPLLIENVDQEFTQLFRKFKEVPFQSEAYIK